MPVIVKTKRSKATERELSDEERQSTTGASRSSRRRMMAERARPSMPTASATQPKTSHEIRRKPPFQAHV
jgi:hypothetical protein